MKLNEMSENEIDEINKNKQVLSELHLMKKKEEKEKTNRQRKLEMKILSFFLHFSEFFKRDFL